MKRKLMTAALGLSLGAMLPLSAAETPSWQVPIPTTAREVPGPVPGNMMTNAYVQLSAEWPTSGATRW